MLRSKLTHTHTYATSYVKWPALFLFYVCCEMAVCCFLALVFDTIEEALQQNVLGTLAMLELAKACTRLECFLHVSTAYVSSVPLWLTCTSIHCMVIAIGFVYCYCYCYR